MNIAERKDKALCALDNSLLNKDDMTLETYDAAIGLVNILGDEDFPVAAIRKCLVEIVMCDYCGD